MHHPTPPARLLGGRGKVPVEFEGEMVYSERWEEDENIMKDIIIQNIRVIVFCVSVVCFIIFLRVDTEGR